MEIALPYMPVLNECYEITTLKASEPEIPDPAPDPCGKPLPLTGLGEASRRLLPQVPLSNFPGVRHESVNQRALGTKSDPVSIISGEMAHDFNNLLAIILGYCSELIHDESLSDQHRTVFIEIEKAGERASRLAMQLHGISRNSSDQAVSSDSVNRDC